MVESEKINLVKLLLGNSEDVEDVTDETISAFLRCAASAIGDRMYPFGNNGNFSNSESVPSKYETLQCRLAVRYISRMGGEGENYHNENGIIRTYDSANDEDILREVMQVVNL